MDERSGEVHQDKTQMHQIANIRSLIRWSMILSLGAIVGHAIDAPEHLTEWVGYSAYFVTAGAFQFFYGFGLLIQPWRYDDTGGLRDNAD